MANLTPMKVRGKRGAHQQIDKGPSKRRKMKRESSSQAGQRSNPGAPGPSHKKRAKRDLGLSMLEQLPTEVLHIIFEFSLNPDLAVTSPHLARQLKSEHLYPRLTNPILDAIVSCSERIVTAEQISVARRLMDSKFFTFSTLQAWKDFCNTKLEEFSENSCEDYSRFRYQAWHPPNMDRNFFPPEKLFRPPFTWQRLQLLEVAKWSCRRPLKPWQEQLAYEGLRAAVEVGPAEAVLAFSTFGLKPDIELVHFAIQRPVVNSDVVRVLIDRAAYVNRDNFDFLDPDLWLWMTKEKIAGNTGAIQLMVRLQEILKNIRDRAGKADADESKEDVDWFDKDEVDDDLSDDASQGSDGLH